MSLSQDWNFILLCATSLFVMINPFGIAPVYLSLTHGMTPQERRFVAWRASLTALVIMVLFAVAGNFIFEFFGVRISSLKIVGGIIFFMLGFDLLNARLSSIKNEPVKVREEYSRDIAITPLAIPILCGPGALANVVILAHEAANVVQKIGLLAAALAVIGANFAGLLGASSLMRWLGESGNKVMMRIMGLIMMVIAVEFFFAGLVPRLQELGLTLHNG
ncbi:MAG: NAAT family transporter [Gammaproteobacteria bacterium]|nr:MAG: NAAT family transporter [Gammaproteobacteria bacterium]